MTRITILARYKAKKSNPILDIRPRVATLRPIYCTGHAFYARYKAQDDNLLPDIRPMITILDDRPCPYGSRDGLPKPDLTTRIAFICPI